jgi:nondiscriminating aspartyl-tRNA synthetase
MIYEFKKDRILVSQINLYLGKKIIIQGWLNSVNELNDVLIIELRDRSGSVSIIINNNNNTEIINNYKQGTILTIDGYVEQIQNNGIIFKDAKLKIDVPIRFTSPIDISKPIDHSIENLNEIVENRALNIRNTFEQTIFRINTNIEDLIRHYLKQHDFFEFHSPKILACASEGGTEIFKLDYFGKEATLAQSAQFYKQIMAQGFERVFEIGSTFRAEPKMSTRHLTDFMTLDVEMAFINNLNDVMNLLSSMLVYITENIWTTHGNALNIYKAKRPLLKQKFPIITLKQLHDLYLEKTGRDCRLETDPTPFEEEWICNYSAEHWGSEAVFITEFPASTMKFYQYRNDDNPEVIDRFDLIFKGVEICTGGRRENRYEKLIGQMKQLEINPDNYEYQYYLQALKFGAPAHGGFGLGLARLTQLIIGLESVKEAVLFVRDKDRLLP